MLAKVEAPAHFGINGQLVDVECDITNGLPAFVVVGLGDKAVDEAKDRVRSAIKNSGLIVPPKRITLNLAPADLPKDGTAYDLSIAIAILTASEQVRDVQDSLFVGELALDGTLRPIRGALTSARLATRHGLKQIFLPSANAAEAALIKDVTVFPANSLLEVYRHLVGEAQIQAIAPVSHISKKAQVVPNFSSIYGQAEAKRALEIAAAGNHNVLLTGPPGSGKTMLSKAVVGLLPPLTLDEIIEVTQLHSLAGQAGNQIVTNRPFRQPHHTASNIALIGGGQWPRPGEISLSHRGVLFLDELPEFPRSVLEVLRQPLEDNVVTIARASTTITYPADFMLVAAQNPCPCGYAGDELKECSCSMGQITRYNKKVSGPLLDRIDLIVHVNRVNSDSIIQTEKSEDSQSIAKRVVSARHLQKARYGNEKTTNATMDNEDIQKLCQLQPEATQLIKEALSNLQLSARGYTRIMKVARTIADLENNREITKYHLAEALQYRAKGLFKF